MSSFYSFIIFTLIASTSVFADQSVFLSEVKVPVDKTETLHVFCNEAKVKLFESQVSEQGEAVYTYVDLISDSGESLFELMKDYIDENTIHYYDLEDNLAAEYFINEGAGYYIYRGEKIALKNCELVGI